MRIQLSTDGSVLLRLVTLDSQQSGIRTLGEMHGLDLLRVPFSAPSSHYAGQA